MRPRHAGLNLLLRKHRHCHIKALCLAHALTLPPLCAAWRLGRRLTLHPLCAAWRLGRAAHSSSPLRCLEAGAGGSLFLPFALPGSWRWLWGGSRLFVVHASREEEQLPRVLFSPGGNALPPEMQIPRIAKFPNFKIVVCLESHVSPSEATDFKGTPPECPHVMTHNFAYQTHERPTAPLTRRHVSVSRNIHASVCWFFSCALGFANTRH